MSSNALRRPDMPDAADPWGAMLRRAAAFQLAALAITAGFVLLHGNDDLPYFYFFTQDVPMLVVGGVALWLLAFRDAGGPVPALARTRAMAICGVAAAAAYAGAFLVMHHYGLSRDEQMADFGAAYLAQGRLGMAIPDALRPLGRAMAPVFTNVYPTGIWTSDYLPVNSAFRAAAMALGDAWLAGPVLLLVGLAALWSAARRIWPGMPQAATVALILTATSTQLLVTAMSPFAMTGHFALNALWIACFMRDDRWGRAGAVVVTLLAVGLHQAHFHLLFLSGFLIVLALRRRWLLLALYGGAAVAGYLLWQIGYRQLIPALFDPHPVAGQVAARAAGDITGRLAKVIGQDTLRHFARFAAWQNILAIPLAAIGIAGIRRQRNAALTGCALSCLVGLLLMPVQEHGFGYRYLHGLIGPLCLLAAQGWIAIGERRGRALPASALWTSAAVALVFTLPYACWRSMAYAAPYEAAYRAVRAADTDFVLIDTSPQTYISDIVRFDLDKGPTQRPVIADLTHVPADALAAICARHSVTLVTARELAQFDLPPFRYAFDKGPRVRARLAEMRRMGCGTPLPTR